MSAYDEFPDPAPIIREWIKRNRYAGPLVLAQFNSITQQDASNLQPGAGLFAWLSIAFAAGREYGETKNGDFARPNRRVCARCYRVEGDPDATPFCQGALETDAAHQWRQ